MANKRFIVKNGLDNSGDNSVVNTITNVAEPTNNSDAATKYYVDTHSSGGTVTAVTGTLPVESTGGTTPDISLGTGANGQLLIGTGTGFTKTTLTQGSGVTITNASGAITIAAAGSGGDVVGPASSTDNAITRFDGTTGKIIQNSTATLSDGGIMIVTELNTDSIKSATANSPIVIAPDGTGDVHLNTDSVRIGDNNSDATIATRGTGDLIITTNEGSGVEGIVRLYDGANGNITLTPNGTGQVQVGTDQVVTLIASQTLTNKSISGSTNTLSNIANASLTNSTISGVSLGSNLNTLTISSPLTGTSYNGSAAVSIGIPVATTSVNGYLSSTDWTTFNNKGSGTVTSVTGTSPVVSSGGTTPAISMPVATTSVSGYLSSTDWTTFNNKGSGSVTSVAATVPSLLSISGSPITTSGTLAITYSGTALPVANGGTGLTTLTAGYIPYGAGTSAFGSSANLFWDSTNSRLGISSTTPSVDLEIGSNTSTTRVLSVRYSSVPLYLSGGYDGTYALSTFSTNSYANATGSGQSWSSFSNTGYSNAAVQLASSTSGSEVRILTAAAANTNPTERVLINSSGNVILNNGSSSSGTSTATPKNIRFNNDFSSGYTDASLKLYLFNSGATIQGLTSGPAFDLQYHSSGSASGRHAWYLDNAEKMRLDATGLGIGTASPRFALSLGSTSSTATATPNTIDLGGTFSSTAGANPKLRLFYDGTNSYGFGISANQLDYIVPSGASHTWFIAGSESMRLNSTGLGIGTASPSYKLDVSGTIHNNNAVFISHGVQGNSSGITFSGVGSNYGRVWEAANDRWALGYSGSFGGASTEALNWNSSGNVGIGTALPAFKLHTYIASGTSMFKFESGANTGIYGYWARPNQSYIQALNLDNNGDKDFSLYDATNSQVADRYYPSSSGYRAFFTNGSERVRIDSSGNVGIGTASPYNKVEIEGASARLGLNNGGGASRKALVIEPLGYSGNTYARLESYDYGTSTGGILALNVTGGNVGIGTASPTNKLQVNGVMVGNNAAGSYTKGFGGILTTTSTSTPTGGSSGDFALIY